MSARWEDLTMSYRIEERELAMLRVALSVVRRAADGEAIPAEAWAVVRADLDHVVRRAEGHGDFGDSS